MVDDILAESAASDRDTYDLDAQVGFLLRKATQRHLSIFGSVLPEVTATQFATMAKAYALGAVSQNELGRATAMDAATIKGVIDRLQARGLMKTEPHPSDRRRLMVTLTGQGREAFDAMTARAHAITAETLAPLTRSEQRALLKLLGKLT